MHRIIKTHYHCAHSLVLVVFAILAGAPVVANAETLLWSDEFDSGTSPNPDVWTPDLGNWGWGNNELQNYTSDPANLRVENGNLVITAQKSGNGAGASFTSARIKTLDKLTFTYGTIEARIRVPDLGNGLWPAFWTLGNNFPQVGWPFCGELDVMEMGHVFAINDGVINRRMGSAAHWDSNGYASYGEFYDAPNDLNDDYHTFRMEWTPDYVSTYVDGSWVWSMDISSLAEFSEFHAPHFILLNLAVGGSFTGILNPAGITAPFSAEYLVDYIRIYDNGHTVLGGSSLDDDNTDPPITSALIDNGPTTIDTASGLEWLDLTFTQGVTAQDVLAGFGGHIAAGWTFATVDQVCALLGALGDDTSNCTTGAVGVQMDPANAETFVNLLGSTAASGRGAYGMFNNIDEFPDNFGLVCINDTAVSCTGGGGSSWLALAGWASGYQTVGSFLVRPTTDVDGDGDGVPDASDQCPGTLTGIPVDAAGCSTLDSDGDGVSDGLDQCPGTSAGTTVDASGCSASATQLIDNGATTIDTASGLEWLDLTFTQGVIAQDVLAGFGGYIAAGWTFATIDQVCGLLGALGDDTTDCTTGAVGVQMDPVNAETFVDLLGNTVATGRGAYGMFNNIGGFPDNFGLACINDTATSCTGGGSGSWLTLAEWASGYQTVGSFLVRPTSDADGDGVPDAGDQCPGTPAATPVNASGCALATSLKLEAEEYTAYWDSDPGSNGAAGNSGEDVDIEATTDAGGGRNVGWAVAGEWLEYQVNLSAGVYAVDTRVASQVSSGAYDLLLDDVVFGSDTVPSTGGWQVWETHRLGSVTVATSGLHTLRVNVTGNDFNLNWIELTKVADISD